MHHADLALWHFCRLPFYWHFSIALGLIYVGIAVTILAWRND